MRHTRVSMLAGLLIASLLIAMRLPAAGEDKLVNINTASAEELEAVKGLGAVKAKRVIDRRPKT